MSKRFFRCILILCVSLSVLSGCAGSSNKEVIYYTDYPYYDSIEEAKNKADMIIEGTILSTKTVTLDPAQKLTDEEKKDPGLYPGGPEESSSFVYTIYQVEVVSKYKGEVEKGDTIEFKRLGGTEANVHYVEEDAMNMEIGETYILFLETYPDSPASLINPIQGVYKCEGNEIIRHEKNTIDLKIEDLEMESI